MCILLTFIRESRLARAGRKSPWRPLSALPDRKLPKLENLRRARRRGIATVEPTFWAAAHDLEGQGNLDLPGLAKLVGFPCILRSCSPTEDTLQGSQAGRFVSVIVHRPEAMAGALARVISSLPAGSGQRMGAVAVQPFLAGSRAGVTFFDGFYFEETAVSGQNTGVTSGRRRGRVCRGHITRGEAQSDWLLRLHRLIGGPLDAEWTEDAGGRRILIQVRPALFPVRRCETLSLANNKETLGEVPSPWIAGVYADVGHPVHEFARRADRRLPDWNEPYTIELAGRVWVNFSSLFRLMDRWGLPRSLVWRSLGGAPSGPVDDRFLPGPFLRSLPALVKIAWNCLASDLVIGRDLHRVDKVLDAAHCLADLWDVNVRVHQLSIRHNFALIAVSSAASGLRRWLGIASRANPITQAMMAEYAAIRARPRPADRLQGIDDWLRHYGHRGPLETDPSQPRFIELSEELKQDVARTETGQENGPAHGSRPSAGPALLSRLLCHWEQRREWFRHSLMRRTQRLRQRILEEARRAVDAGCLDIPEDVFLLTRNDLTASPDSWKARVGQSRARLEQARRLSFPTSTTRDLVEESWRRSGSSGIRGQEGPFVGIGFGSTPVTGTVVRARTIHEILRRQDWPQAPILVADALGPSWAVVFPRFNAVVCELGGELSHAAILLREAKLPCVINAAGAFRSLAEGDTIRVNPASGEVVLVAHRAG